MREMQATAFRRMPIVEMGRDDVIEVKSRETVLGYWVPRDEWKGAAQEQLGALTQACRFLLWEYDDAGHYDDHFYAHELSDQIAGIRLAMEEIEAMTRYDQPTSGRTTTGNG